MRFVFTALLISASAICNAQSDYTFTSGLAVAGVHHYGREAIVTDQLAYQLFQDQLKKPGEGVVVTTDENGEDIRWTRIEVDSTGKFRGQAIMNGYIYLTYDASRAQNAVLNVTGNSMVYVNGEPRGGDIYSDGWMHLPVNLRKGANEILIRCGGFSRWQGVTAKLSFPVKSAWLSTDDATLPHILPGESNSEVVGGIVVINASGKTLTGLSITSELNGKQKTTAVRPVGPAAVYKVSFYFDGSAVSSKGEYACHVVLKHNGKTLDEKDLTIIAVGPGDHRSYTFISDIDGSVQYYAVAPQTTPTEAPALFLSVHGAGVEAIGQARAYKPKDWGVLVAPTNRRPRGFNWEDWGRLDALEVLEHATKMIRPDPTRIYLTGHSMGGHGTWYLGATYPDKWAAIAPCAGYPTLTAYGSADGRIPDSARSEAEKTLLQASNPSNVIALAGNYKNHGVYIFHGDNDRVVPVRFARQMRDLLGDFHPDFSYYEYPGGSHWFGNESVDWPPLFEYFRWHTLKADSAADEVDFTTANPGVSASFRWASVLQQTEPLGYSHIKLSRDKKARTISGITGNVAALRLNLDVFNTGDTVILTLDSVKLTTVVIEDRATYLYRTDERWSFGEAHPFTQKNPMRSGTFKDAFNHRMIFVYATGGNASEDQWAYNKARYDAEVWYYRANGAVEIIPDKDFEPGKYPDRGVILYGNASNNSAWNKLLANCPIQVTRDRITLGSRTFRGDDLATYFVWPRADSKTASVGVVAGTGTPGLFATESNQYFAGGSGFPDYVIFSLEMLKSGADGVKAAGFFDNSWGVQAY
ncbi:MAG: prolyl oligopeptidase family serine peptidase [Bacteroidota bacterium]|nr:prolyl oligopeptidase family serine peptidase [Bacteroidota bacterium]